VEEIGDFIGDGGFSRKRGEVGRIWKIGGVVLEFGFYGFMVYGYGVYPRIDFFANFGCSL
jgi:hypothetical protein